MNTYFILIFSALWSAIISSVNSVYIKNIDINHKDHISAIEKYCDEYLDISLKLGISFFEQLEEYEKCALLKQVLDKSQEFSK